MQLAREFADFLLPMLAFDPHHRAAASECLKHPWLTGVPLDEQQQKEQAEKRHMSMMKQAEDPAGLDHVDDDEVSEL